MNTWHDIKVIIEDKVITMRWERNGTLPTFTPTATLQYSNGRSVKIDLPVSHPGHDLVVRPLNEVTLEYIRIVQDGIQHDIVVVNIKNKLSMASEGKNTILYVNPSYRNYLAGMCGRSDTKIKSAEQMGRQSCKYTKASLEVASNRIETASCPAQEESIKE